jgi:hypothetical protein
MPMTEAVAALLGASIGGVFGFLGSYLTARHQARLERDRWERAHSDRLDEETRVALAELTRTLAGVSHSIMWATYRALRDEEANEVVDVYEKELHEGIADAVKAQMHVAALSHSLYSNVTQQVSEIIRLGSDSSKALAGARKNFDAHRQDLLICNQRALRLIKSIPAEFGEMLRL